MAKDPVDIDELNHDLDSFEPLPADDQFDLDYTWTREDTEKALEQIKRKEKDE